MSDAGPILFIHFASEVSMSLRTRAFAAIALMVGFYIFSIGLMCLLVWIPYAEWTYLDRIDFRIAIGCLVGAFAIMVSIVPRRDVFSPPGPRIEANQHPRLFAELAEIAKSTGEAMPEEVYLIPDVNAWVSQRGGIMGLGSRRVMGLGVPLMTVLNVSQFRAVIAHEFGHYYGGDTKLGPWIYQTRSAIGRTLARLEQHQSWLIILFNLYAKFFLHVTLAISRAQEYAADRIGAQMAGVNSMIEGLKQIHRAGPFWSGYVGREIVPILNRNFSPPISQGFAHFLATPEVSQAAEANLQSELRDAKSETLDTHPALPERIAALKGIEHFAEEDTRPARALLENADSADCELFLTGPGVQLDPIPWEQVNEKVWIPAWREQVVRQLEALGGMKVSDLPQQLFSGELRTRIKNPPGIWPTTEERGQIARAVAGAALALLLVQEGWAVHALPGEFYFEKSGKRLQPFADVEALAQGAINADQWLRTATDVGIAELRLTASVTGAASASTAHG